MLLKQQQQQAAGMQGGVAARSSQAVRTQFGATHPRAAARRAAPAVWCRSQRRSSISSSQAAPPSTSSPQADELQPQTQEQQQQQPEVTASSSSSSSSGSVDAHVAFLASFGLFLMSSSPAMAEAAQTFEPVNPFSGVYAPGQYVTLFLFLITVPGIWSQVKRAPKASKKRKVYEVAGPAAAGPDAVKNNARQIVSYFRKYNYDTKEMGEVITFVGTYKASRGQAAAVTFYTFVGMASIALVMSLLVPQIGNYWYALTLLAPGAWIYYFQQGTRQEEVKVKMATADDEQTTDISIEGDPEEIDRFRRELNLMEKGMVPVKGLLEQ